MPTTGMTRIDSHKVGIGGVFSPFKQANIFLLTHTFHYGYLDSGVLVQFW